MKPPPDPDAGPLTFIRVDGKAVAGLHNYSVRWVQVGKGGQQRWHPVLYCSGKRVVKAWSLLVSADTPADPDGGNANTD